jgi:hypothetical protein
VLRASARPRELPPPLDGRHKIHVLYDRGRRAGCACHNRRVDSCGRRLGQQFTPSLAARILQRLRLNPETPT